MPSVTSYCNRGLLHHNLSQYWPLWSFCTGLWLLLMPVNLYNHFAYQGMRPEALELRYEVLKLLPLSLWMTAGFAVLFAMATGAFLCSSRSVNFFHSLPLRRETIFITNTLSGLLFFLIPHTIAAGLTLGVELILGAVDLYSIALWAAFSMGMGLFFYAFALCVTMCTGQLLAIPVLYIIFNFLAVGFEALVRNLSGMFLYGWSGNYGDMRTEVLSPLYYLGSHLQLAVERDWDGDNELLSVYAQGMGAAAVYTAVGLLLLGVALLLYRRRASERAGDTIAFAKLRPLFRWGVTVCAGLSVGQGIYLLVWGNLAASRSAMAVCVAIASLSGFLAAEMLLRKTVRLPKSCIKKGGIAFVLMLGASLGLSCDITGYETRIPDASEVLSCQVYGLYCYGYEEEAERIDEVLALHASIIADREEQEERQKQASTGPWDGEYGYCTLYYTLTDGTLMRRSYSLYYKEADAQNPNSVYATWLAFINRPDVVWQTKMGGELYQYLQENAVSEEIIQTAYIHVYDEISPEEGITAGYRALRTEDALRLLRAVQKDMEEGNFAKVLGNETQTACAVLEINGWLPSEEEKGVPTGVPTVEATTEDTYYYSVEIDREMTHTMEALRGM